MRCTNLSTLYRIVMLIPPTEAPVFKVRRADWSLDRDALRLVRQRVFIEEQAVPVGMEWDDKDEQAVQLLALDADNHPIGTARLLPTGQIGRMAVLPQWRHLGVGGALLSQALDIARAEDLPRPFLNAQSSALPFYERKGFVPVGEGFQEAGIPHYKMILGNETTNKDPDLTHQVLGTTAGKVDLPTLEAIRTTGLRMVSQTTRELRLFSHDLDAPLYDNQEFLDQVRRITIHGRDIPVRILLFDAEPAIRKGNRLIEMARHMTSQLQIRRVSSDFSRHTEAYLLADERGYVMRRLADVFEGTADFNAPVEARNLHDRFDHIWSSAEIHQELRRLYL